MSRAISKARAPTAGPGEGRVASRYLAVTVSLGGALGPVRGAADQALHGIIQLADQRLLAAKRAGRNQALTQESPALAPGLAGAIW